MEWLMCYGKIQKRINEYSEDSADVGGLLATCIHCDGGEEQTEERVHLPPGDMMIMTRPGYCQGPYWGPWSYNSHCLC